MGARVMSLADPSKKMSKSDESKNATLSLLDDADTIRKKIMRAVTDSDAGVTYDPEKKPAVANLMNIFHHMTGKTMKEIELTFAGKGYGDFKKALAEAVVEHVSPITKRIHAYRDDPAELMRILDKGRDDAKAIAQKKIAIVRERMGVWR
jgi:tryptophanyl-tRNA synthetase